MNNLNNHIAWPNRNIVRLILTALLLTYYSVSEIFASSSKDIVARDKFVITGSEFCRRSEFDAGEIRTFLVNTGKEPMSISQCKLYRFIASKDERQNELGREVNHVYSKLSPPILMPGQNGELLIKLLNTPPNSSELECTIYDKMGGISATLISIEQAPIWISYAGFSEDLSKVYVYVQNNTETTLRIQLLGVRGVSVRDTCRSINNDPPPGDKGCLVFKMPMPLALGEYVHITISAKSGDQEFQTHRTVRAVNKFPLLSGSGSPNPRLGLDSESFFVQTMECPAHAHGTHENAARKFLDDRYRRFSQNPYLITQMWICRADRPRAWYKFGPLPDVAVMNTILFTSSAYKSDPKTYERFSPFFWLATMAKKAAAPNRYLACIPVTPEKGVFAQSSHTPDEVKFLVYCAIAAGAKGILYRGVPSSDPLSHDAFMQLNNELLQLKSWLAMAEPVNWASTADDNYVAKSLLCGDEAILVIAFDRRYFSEQQNNKLHTPAFGKAVKPAKIKVKIPKGFSAFEVKSMYTALSKNLWYFQEGQLDFTAHMIDSVQVYRIILKRTSSE